MSLPSQTQSMNSHSQIKQQISECQVILGNSNKRFSGVTSTMLATAQVQHEQIALCVLGKHHVPKSLLAVNFWQAARWLQQSKTDSQVRVFHARRNDEMIQALLLKYVFGIALKIVFTSTAQRQHSKFTRWLMDKMDAVISTNSAAASYLAFAPDALIPHGVDHKKFSPVIDRTELREQLGRPRLHMAGIFGRVRRQKGIHLFVQACIETCQQQADFQAVICGAYDDQEYVEQLKQQIAQAKLSHRIKFLGEQPFSQVVKWMQACDIVCALSENEGFGLTVLEAMSCGAAVIATRAGAWPDIIRNGQNGVLVNVNAQAEITNALQTLASQAKLRMAFSVSARQTVLNHYRIESEALALCELYQNLLKQA
ncbi:glycosyltransferase family 4 domain-containing protein [Catenovulum agarivorans DS-2]|uniref:Glycosyltransferase family 4 domain-containing protein n=1 Tax=Catenovulum agarivorans DS-2 TaxID=1328313 RepID=W7QQD5_9ALTE|nr:glycosyltransferase family 4 protein [Catenovulum agarivorans]EWH11187.1 glycosyltransferase family 4 domain-containing protein [Catenovulum agarivorans DS-2]